MPRLRCRESRSWSAGPAPHGSSITAPAKTTGTIERFSLFIGSKSTPFLSPAGGRKAYNRNVKFWRAVVLCAALLVVGCSRGNQTPEAVRQGILDYLSTRSDLDLASMQVEVTSVSFRQNEADATVAFRPKGGGPGSGMQMRYTLDRSGSGWVVKGKGQAPSGSPPHGVEPSQAPAKSAAAGPASDLPPGHPTLSRGKPSGTKK